MLINGPYAPHLLCQLSFPQEGRKGQAFGISDYPCGPSARRATSPNAAALLCTTSRASQNISRSISMRALIRHNVFSFRAAPKAHGMQGGCRDAKLFSRSKGMRPHKAHDEFYIRYQVILHASCELIRAKSFDHKPEYKTKHKTKSKPKPQLKPIII